MSIESTTDWKGMRRVARVVRLTLDALERNVAPGITTGELDAIASGVFRGHRARSAPAMVYGFPGTVLISINDEVVHGVPGGRRLRAGDVVKLDVTAELDGYIADAARTVVVAPAAALAFTLQRCASDAFDSAVVEARDGWTVRTRDGSLAAHHEHTIVITRGLPVVLTAAC